jgi:hypothetical protein
MPTFNPLHWRNWFLCGLPSWPTLNFVCLPPQGLQNVFGGDANLADSCGRPAAGMAVAIARRFRLPVPPLDVFCLPTQLFGNGLNHSGEVFSTRKMIFCSFTAATFKRVHFSD